MKRQTRSQLVNDETNVSGKTPAGLALFYSPFEEREKMYRQNRMGVGTLEPNKKNLSRSFLVLLIERWEYVNLLLQLDRWGHCR